MPVAGYVLAVIPENSTAGRAEPDPTDSATAWLRLAAAVVLSTIGGVGMWSVVVALPAIQAEFGVDRATASLPYTLTMLGFAGGGVVMGRLADRYGITVPVIVSTLALGAGYVAVGNAASLWQVAIAHGLLIGAGTSATFGPLMADISHWFTRRRGIAVAAAASGNYLAGTIWPPVVQHFIAVDGWRATYIGIGLFCLVTMLPLSLALRRRIDAHHAAAASAAAALRQADLPLSPAALQVLLYIAGLACCVAMSMPQVHIVAYCGDLGYGVARGADMLSLMLGFGIVSRIASGFIADRIGGVRTLLLGSVAAGNGADASISFSTALRRSMSFRRCSACSRAASCRATPSSCANIFQPSEASTRVGLVVMATVLGMALGGWMSGAIFDLTGSYQAAFLNGLAWNLLNVSIAIFLLLRSRGRPLLAQSA